MSEDGKRFQELKAIMAVKRTEGIEDANGLRGPPSQKRFPT